MIKLLLGTLITLLIIVAIPLAVLGLVPGISQLIGAGPKDLGIKITLADSLEAQKKAGTEIVPITEGINKADYTLEGKKNADFTMDSKELTAHANNRPWKNYPVKSLQIKIHENGLIESSGILVVGKTIPYAMALGYSESQIRDAMHKYSIPPVEVPFYIMGTGSVINDAVMVNAQQVKIGAIPIPAGIVIKANKEAESLLGDIIQKHKDAFHAESLTFENGLMHFKGQVPEKEYVLVK